ncbi:MAG: hypothetical protein ACK4PI_06770 [Tepidisphaerales bacterium]
MSSGNSVHDDGGLTEAMSGGGEDFLVENEAKSGPKPALLVALVIAVVGGGGYLWLNRKGPAVAGAAPAAAVTPADNARQTINEFLAGGGKDLVAMEQMLRNTEAVVQQFLTYPSVTQVPLESLRTNPFRLSEPEAPKAAEPDDRRRREEARNRALKAVAELRVESVMTNAAGGSAIINGKFVRPGDTVDGFLVEAIRPGSVIVRDDRFRFELKLAR